MWIKQKLIANGNAVGKKKIEWVAFKCLETQNT